MRAINGLLFQHVQVSLLVVCEDFTQLFVVDVQAALQHCRALGNGALQKLLSCLRGCVELSLRGHVVQELLFEHSAGFCGDFAGFCCLGLS